LSRFFNVSVNQLKREECDEQGKFYDAGEFTVGAKSQYLKYEEAAHRVFLFVLRHFGTS
jgi:hypothetical protein